MRSAFERLPPFGLDLQRREHLLFRPEFLSTRLLFQERIERLFYTGQINRHGTETLSQDGGEQKTDVRIGLDKSFGIFDFKKSGLFQRFHGGHVWSIQQGRNLSENGANFGNLVKENPLPGDLYATINQYIEDARLSPFL